MASRYAWHPPHRPPTADVAKCARIALISPIGKCLQTALDEILAEDKEVDTIENNYGGNNKCTNDDMTDGIDKSENDGSDSSEDNLNDREEKCGKKRKLSLEEANGDDRRNQAEPMKKSDNTNTDSQHMPKVMKMDETISKSILDSYCKSFAETIFDNNEKGDECYSTSMSQNNPANSKKYTAPAAMLRGEIDHYNRIGGQWRIVVKNAVLRSRSLIRIDNGRKGKSKRFRMALNWDGDCKKDKQNVSSLTKNQNNNEMYNIDASDVKIDGTIQILAYDDEDG